MPDPNPQQHSELASFGEDLRREREIRGISLKEIADATKISRRFLEAIERNDHKTLPAPVFTRGFVREYARYLGLNSEEMVHRYNYAALGDDRIEQSDHLERLVHPETALEPPKKTGIPAFNIDKNIVWTVLTVAALAGVIYWAVTTKQMRGPAPPVVAVAPGTIGLPEPREEGGSLALSGARDDTRGARDDTRGARNDTRTPDDGRLHLSINVTDNSWVTLEVDGQTALNDELVAGSTHTFAADRQFRFRTVGNAAGLALTLNGRKMPPLGQEGEVVRNRIFDRQFLDRQP
ncbi:MAG TPA: helix-turn-helix domain-containing protein [Thermoanaerobaculia bacterium]|nr:helix-turn-helix domain-containing protein [Thermoanaerobaculia bacterium]